MGYDTSTATFERVQKLNGEGRRCKSGGCTKRATWALTILSVDCHAGEIHFSNRHAPHVMGFCGACVKRELRAYEVHGTPNFDGELEYTVEHNGVVFQVNTLQGVRKLTRTEVLS
mgnify:CR=1 FL=1